MDVKLLKSTLQFLKDRRKLCGIGTYQEGIKKGLSLGIAHIEGQLSFLQQVGEIPNIKENDEGI